MKILLIWVTVVLINKIVLIVIKSLINEEIFLRVPYTREIGRMKYMSGRIFGVCKIKSNIEMLLLGKRINLYLGPHNCNKPFQFLKRYKNKA